MKGTENRYQLDPTSFGPSLRDFLLYRHDDPPYSPQASVTPATRRSQDENMEGFI